MRQAFDGLDSQIDGQGLNGVKNKFDYFRKVYDYWLPKILEYKGRGIDPYFVNWVDYMTPIELQAWYSIRAYGLPLYPQVPVLNYFIDFANPYYKIGIELDGKDYHNCERDAIRDNNLYTAGWRIFRITGSEMMSLNYKTQCEIDESGKYTESEKERETIYWLIQTGDGILAALGHVYFRKYNIPNNMMSVIYRTLDNHRLADFELLDESYEEETGLEI